MGNEYLKYPATVKSLAEELKTACDNYLARNINNDNIKEIVLWYAKNQANKLFFGNDFNPTISKIVGKKRIKIIGDLLHGADELDKGLTE